MSAADRPAGYARPEDPLRDVARAHRPFPWGRVVVWTVVLVFVADFTLLVAGNENFGWPVIFRYLFDPVVMQGLSVTLILTVIAMTLGVALGLPIAIARMSDDRLLGGLAWISSGSSAAPRCWSS